MNAAELEIALHRRDAESYHVDLRFHLPASDADVRPAAREPGTAAPGPGRAAGRRRPSGPRP
ncbi:MAG: hypothetical protein H6645_03260 [Caldilineaceae bacterium]|nr:hypothetical protein [Caldilineaceae bacterium]